MIKSSIEKILQSVGITGEINLSLPPKVEMGDLAFACFDLAKAKGMNPAEFAKELADKIKPLGIVSRVQAFGPYVNFFLDSGKVSGLIIAEVLKNKNKFGANKTGAGKSVLLEYPSNNTHKELHVGHLRNICIGNSLTKLFVLNGYKAIPINYVNDFGAHVAKCLWGMQKFHAKENSPKDKQKWLGEIYAESARYLKDHPEAKDEVAQIQLQLEKKDKKIWALYTKTRKWSLDAFAKVFKELGVTHKKTFFEQDIKNIGQKVVDELLKKGIAKVGEGGAIIVDLSPYNLDIGLLRKSNGAGLYLTADLGLALAKNKAYPKISESIHITASEQNFYFQQLFKILALAGYNFKMTHIGYGLVNLPTGKMSSREGTAVLYEDVFDSVYERTLNETKSRHADWTNTKITQTARALAYAAIKFDFLKHESSKVIVFDPKDAVSFDGFTGPYVLYSLARMNSILSKAKKTKVGINYSALTEPEEKALTLFLAEFMFAVNKAFANYNPSVITKYAFDLAKLYNEFYNKHSVLQAANKEIVQARLALTLAVKVVLENALDILSIKPVAEM
ncbi:MAG: arginine--tRNA ligase [Patescibacteria group bacterium]